MAEPTTLDYLREAAGIADTLAGGPKQRARQAQAERDEARIKAGMAPASAVSPWLIGGGVAVAALLVFFMVRK